MRPHHGSRARYVLPETRRNCPGNRLPGGQTIDAEAPIEYSPVHVRDSADLMGLFSELHSERLAADVGPCRSRPELRCPEGTAPLSQIRRMKRPLSCIEKGAMVASHEIEGLLFDLGGVMFEIDFGRTLRRWSEMSSLPIEEMRRRFRMDSAYERHERGEIEAVEYFAHLRKVLELEGPDEDIASGWNAIYGRVITETLDTILSVKDRLPCFALTNTNRVHQAAWMVIYPSVVSAFDRVFVSWEMGLRKPEPAAFRAVADATGIPPNRTLFFDDAMENVKGAREAGLQAVLVRAPSDVRRALAEIGAWQPEDNARSTA
jgi:FMN phosphatase YigB (HAD superfamily)